MHSAMCSSQHHITRQGTRLMTTIYQTLQDTAGLPSPQIVAATFVPMK